ncbi:hypothetical protein MTR67_052861 [Solanum verrucosum]|uniref:Reverse transcriptase/retrotransposon-derived protein RNase H-like domain-containing protein n=1 Tax=Solanum verrucosum TaxID=315347 RepID=A0AAF1A1F4_SOLVR|nr:hypothetical protein MTR67_052861 [Solanum verrucosum]
MVDPQKIKAVKNLVRLNSVTEVRSFVGLASYYRRFVKNFASIATRLTNLTKKEIPFEWTEKYEERFQKLKTLLTTAPILALPVKGKDFIVYCDASHSDLGVVLMHDDYDVTIQYHSGKANVVADTLNRKTVSMGSLAYLSVTKRHLAKEIQTLESKFMQLGISEKGRVLASIDVMATFVE